MYRWVKSCCEGCGCLILELFDSTEQQKHMVHWISVISFDLIYYDMTCAGGREANKSIFFAHYRRKASWL